jgi:hypothetical protein
MRSVSSSLHPTVGLEPVSRRSGGKRRHSCTVGNDTPTRSVMRVFARERRPTAAWSRAIVERRIGDATAP